MDNNNFLSALKALPVAEMSRADWTTADMALKMIYLSELLKLKIDCKMEPSKI